MSKEDIYYGCVRLVPKEGPKLRCKSKMKTQSVTLLFAFHLICNAKYVGNVLYKTCMVQLLSNGTHTR